MRTVTAYFCSGEGVRLSGLLLLMLLQGCITVDTKCGGCCGPTSGGGDGGDKPKGCNDVYIPPAWTVAYNTYFRSGGAAVPNDGTYQCVSGSRCAGLPGKCVIGGPNCKTWFTPTSPGSKQGSCDCDCP